MITDFELQKLIDIPPLEIQKLRVSDINDQIATSLQTYDVESLLLTQVKPRYFKQGEQITLSVSQLPFAPL